MKYSSLPSKAQLRNKTSFLIETQKAVVEQDQQKESAPVLPRILERISRGSLFLFLFLIPIFFLPFTPDFIEFNKQYLLYGLVTISLLAWVGQGFINRGFKIPRTALTLPILGLLGVVLVSSIFSKDRTASFFGEYDRLTFGFIPLLWYVFLFYLLVYHLRAAKQIRWMFSVIAMGATISGLYFWAAAFGLTRLPFLAPFLPAWNTVSGVNSRFALMLIVPLLIALTFLLEPQISRGKKILWSAQALIAFLTIVAFGFKGVFLVSAVGLALWLAVIFTRLEGVRVPIVSFTMVGFLAFTIFSIFGTGGFVRVAALPAEVSLSHNASWNIALDTLKEGVGRALVGTGPSTFGEDFSAHRPQEFNSNPFWSLRFSTASSEAAGLAATLGAIGVLFLVGLLCVVFWFFKNAALRSDQANTRSDVLLGGTMGIFVAMFAALLFVPFGTVFWVYFFTMLALFVAQIRLRNPEEAKEIAISFEGSSPSSVLISSFSGVMLLAVLFVLAVYLGRFYAGEIYFRQGLRAAATRDIDGATVALARAAALNNEQLRYLLSLTQLQFQQASLESQKDMPDTSLVSRFISGALASAKRATERAPNSAGAWEQLGGLYGQIVALAPEARGWAIAAYGEAMELEPTNPTLLVLRGQQYFGDKKVEEAQRDFERAIELKSDYALANMALAGIYESQNDLDKAVKILEQAARGSGGDVGSVYQLARLYFNRNQNEDSVNAERILNAIVARNPNHANAHFTLGSLYERQGKTTDALREFEKVRELDPQNSEARKKVEGFVTPPPPEQE